MPPRRSTSRGPGGEQVAPQGATAPRLLPVPPGDPGPILETDFVNKPLRDHRGNWTSKAVGGKTIDSPSGPDWSWVPLQDHDDEYGGELTGLSGTIVQDPEVSSEDMPFTHPYGNDFEFHVAPDPAYADLAGPNMEGSYADSTKRAKDQFGLNVAGVVGMEWDGGMVPTAYRPRIGHRVCLFGRWIVDAGHDDFHTEIHPPLLMVSAHGTRSSFQAARSRSNDATVASILSRPHLVSQQFAGNGLVDHFLSEVAKAMTFRSTLVRAHPTLMAPYRGLNIMMFKIRPPTPPADPRDELWVEWDLVTRDKGTAIQILRGTGGNSVRVVVVLNEAGYEPPPEPSRRNVRISIDELANQAGEAGVWLKSGVFLAGFVNAVGAAVIARGVETHTYASLPAPRLGNPGRARVADLHGSQKVSVDPSQPFPVAGSVKVEWRRFAITGRQGAVSGGGAG